MSREKTKMINRGSVVGGAREERGEREPNLAFDQLLGHFDGCFTEGSTILGADLCTHCEERRVIAVCLESKGEHRGEGGREGVGRGRGEGVGRGRGGGWKGEEENTQGGT